MAGKKVCVIKGFYLKPELKDYGADVVEVEKLNAEKLGSCERVVSDATDYGDLKKVGYEKVEH